MRGWVLLSVTAQGNIIHGQDSAGWLRVRHLKGDHSPYHVHVYRDGALIVKWDLENDVAMKGEATARILRLIAELCREGQL